MNISDISKVASRKKLNVDAENLRDKVSRETAKIIKLKVAQDTAYWDLKEKLQQVEGNHERLQQNMVEVQMQHEAISGQYQEELRLRPETLNKMSSTREICDVLEEYSERLKETLCRCRRDQAALSDAYRRCGRRARDAHQQLKLTEEHHSQLMQFFTSSKQQLDSELSDTRQKLYDALQHKEELVATAAELRRQLDLKQHDLLAKEEAVTSLQKDIKQLLQEFNMQAGEMKNTLHKQEKEIKEACEANESLKKALSNQEEFISTIRGQNANLQDKISCLEDEQTTTIRALEDIETKLQVANLEIESLKEEIQALNEQKQELENIHKCKDDMLAKYEEELEKVKSQLRNLEDENNKISSQLCKTEGEGKEKVVHIEHLEVTLQQKDKQIADMQDELVKYKETTTQKVEELSANIRQKEKELDDNAETIARLMSDVKATCDARARSELAMQRLKHDHQLERDAMIESERKLLKQVEQLECSVRGKDDELSKQMSIILEIRVEKERLQSKIEGMQGTIDNIQKELTGRTAPPVPRPPPEHDDNALMCPPTKIPPSSPKLPLPGGEYGSGRAETKQLDSMLYNLFSDGSMDGDTIDASEVNRRFDALSRGEQMSPLSLGALKRRRAGVPISQGGLKYKPVTDDPEISLSQVKKDLKNKEKTFFKTKRLDVKSKKPK